MSLDALSLSYVDAVSFAPLPGVGNALGVLFWDAVFVPFVVASELLNLLGEFLAEFNSIVFTSSANSGFADIFTMGDGLSAAVSAGNASTG